jgi:hypothetical protein
MAQQVLPLGDAPRTEDREGGHGVQTIRSSVLDVAQGVGLGAAQKSSVRTPDNQYIAM